MCAYLKDVGTEHNLPLMGRGMNKQNEVALESNMFVSFTKYHAIHFYFRVKVGSWGVRIIIYNT